VTEASATGAAGSDEPDGLAAAAVMAAGARRDDGAVDGRAARGARTRSALVDATLALVEAGDLRPTAPRIAEQAGVSVRSVFQHFDDLETLFSELGDLAFDRIRRLSEPIDPELPLPERVERFVAQRCRVNEAMDPINKAASLQAPTSPAIRAQFERGHERATAHLRLVFGPELAAAGDRAAPLFDGLRFATSWTIWNLCRETEGRSVAESTDAVRRVVALVFAGAGLSVDEPAPSS